MSRAALRIACLLIHVIALNLAYDLIAVVIRRLIRSGRRQRWFSRENTAATSGEIKGLPNPSTEASDLM
jgi:hypothetical protein